jgi:cysteine-rich repeat protein
LPPGTYQLDVHAWSATAVIPSLAVFMQLKPADVCGNAVTEVGVGEACDDGNTTDGDGCSSTCQMEAADISVVATPTLAIPDSTPAGVVTTLVVPATPVCAIGGISVSMDITHTWRGDLIVDLLSPAGTTVRLHNRTGSSADDIVGTYGLDLTPAQPLSGFSGQDPAGTWTLTVSDNAGGDTGTLNGWGLNINCQ